MLAIHRERDAMREELIRRGAPVGLVEALMLGDDARVAGETALPQHVPNGGSLLSFVRGKGQPLVERLAARGVRISSEDYARLGDRRSSPGTLPWSSGWEGSQREHGGEAVPPDRAAHCRLERR